MSDIPLEICREILLRLPAGSLFRLRAVCKGWQTVIDDPCFVKAHTNNQLSSNTLLLRNSTGPPFYPLYAFDVEALNFTNGPQTIPVTPLKLTRSGLSRLPSFPVAACNGLMLIAPMDSEKNRNPRRDRDWDGKGTWEIWNPLTRERLKLPQPTNINSQVMGYGIGYDCADDDYKVVVIDYLYTNRGSLKQTHVYSLKSDSWRKIGDCPFQFMGVRGAFLNGALHWISWGKIIVFDLGTENYRQMKLPFLMKTGQESLLLDALGGYLFLSCYGKEYGSKHLNGWVMNDYGTEDSWMKLFSLDGYSMSMGLDLRPVAYMKNKKQVVLQHYYGLFWFDVESISMKKVSIHGFSRDFSAQICIGSLFRIHDSCGSVAAKRRTKKGKRKMKIADTKLTFCVRDYDANDRSYPSHDSCYSLDSNWYNSSSGGDD